MKISGSLFLKEIGFTTDNGRREDAAGGRSFPFAPGELVHGEVTGLTPEGKVLLTIGGVTIEAKSEVALKVGGEFWFEVRQAGSEPWLALAETKGAVQEVVQQLATGVPSLGRLLPTLVAMLDQDKALPPESRSQLVTLLPALTTLVAQGETLPQETRVQLQELLPTLAMLGQNEALPPEPRSQLATLLPALTTLVTQGETLPQETRVQLQELLPTLAMLGQNEALPPEPRSQLATLLPALTTLVTQGEALPQETRVQLQDLLPTLAMLGQNEALPPESRSQLVTLLPALTTLLGQGGVLPPESRSRLATLLPALTALLEQGGALPPALRAPLATLVQTMTDTALGAEAAPEKLLLLLNSLEGDQGALATAPPLLRQLASLLEALPSQRGEVSAVTVARNHALLSAMAVSNQQVPVQHQPLFWLFPCFFAMGEGAGSWLLQTAAEKGPTGESGYTLSFFLDMSQLGEVQLQVTVQGDQVRGTFALADETAVAHLRQELPELKERLAALGYQVGTFSCTLARERLLSGLKRALEGAAGLGSTRLLDVKA